MFKFIFVICSVVTVALGEELQLQAQAQLRGSPAFISQSEDRDRAITWGAEEPNNNNREYAQCGGTDYSGATSCPEGFTCQPQANNEYYSQCLPYTAPCPAEFTFYEVPGDDMKEFPGSATQPQMTTYLDKTYLTLADTAPNGNFMGVCTFLDEQTTYCSGTYNVDMFYDKVTQTTMTTGACPGSFALSDVFGGTGVRVQPVIGGTGAYQRASGIVTVTYVDEPNKCPMNMVYCFKVEVDLRPIFGSATRE